MIRAIPELQRLEPDAHLLIAGKTEGISYGPLAQKVNGKMYSSKRSKVSTTPGKLVSVAKSLTKSFTNTSAFPSTCLFNVPIRSEPEPA